ncbi:MAG: endonuclease/exonuclease/phosphatase family protein [Bacteroidetes bacterium]|nr:endonuclease/exonuclease/phosphatase family protein [Bacteroidota bacterium]
MKKAILMFCLISGMLCASAQSPITVMTFNIRLNTSSDSLNAWTYRKDKLASQVLFHKADILGVQEALDDQMKDLQTALNNYSYVGVARDDGKTAGEYSAIFYNKKKLEVLKSSTFWLSETPAVAGKKGWDAACARIVTWALMKDKETSRQFYVFNTHFDHLGTIARRESAKMILHAVDSIAGKSIAIVTGDFNAHPDDEPIQVITDARNKLHLTDSKAISVTKHYGPTGTFNGFQSKEINDQPIDYIFFNHGLQVIEHATISESWDGRFASDHFAVLAVVRL